jgi:hypothetical protein
MDDRYEDADAGACYQCGRTWPPGEPERHRPGCPRELVPAGLPEPDTCRECGSPLTGTLRLCPNEGGCSQWRDPGAFEEPQEPDAELAAYGELVAARREPAELDDLPF